MRIRNAIPADDAAIRAVVASAFGRSAEADLVDALRRDGDLVLSLVAEGHDGIAGHIAFSRLRSPAGALALAPLAIAPEQQRRGIGGALVARGLGLAAEHGFDLAFVLGDPWYYGRFGFSAAAAEAYPSRYAGPHHMAIRLTDRGVAAAPVVYAPAFAALG